jgi:predicted protein tyrosine phosphatase
LPFHSNRHDSRQTIAVPGVVFRHLDETDTITTLYIAHRYRGANARAMQFVELALGLRQDIVSPAIP